MNADRTASRAARRAALIAQCAQQRADAGAELDALVTPLSPSHWREYFGKHRKLMLSVAGAAVGFVAMRPKRVLPLITTGLSVYKLARNALAMLRKPAAD